MHNAHCPLQDVEPIRFDPQIVVLANIVGGQLQSSFPFSYTIRDVDLLNGSDVNAGGLTVVAEEAFNPRPVSARE